MLACVRALSTLPGKYVCPCNFFCLSISILSVCLSLCLSVCLCSAQQHGLLCEVDSDDEDKELCDPFFAHCKAHADKDLAKRKVNVGQVLCIDV